MSEIPRDEESSSKKESLSTVMKTTSTKRVVTGGVIYTVVDILGSIFFTIYTIAVGRISENEAAILTVVSTFQYMLKIFALLGFTGAGAKFIAEYLERDKKEARKYGISACKYNFLIFGLPIIGVAVLLFSSKANATANGESTAFLVLIFLVAIDRLKNSADTYLLAYQRYDLYAIAWGVPYGAMYLAAFGLMQVPGLVVVGPLLAWTIGELVNFIWAMYYVKKISDFPVRDLFAWRHEFKLFRKMFSFNFLYSLANLCFSLLTTTLLITLGDSLGILTNREIQALGVVSTFTNILINVFGIVAGIQPAIVQAFALKNKKLMENYFLASVKFPIMMSVAVITFFLIFGEEVITAFYTIKLVVIGLVILAFLIPSYTFGSFASRYDNILAGIGRPETAIIPWFIGIGIAITGIVCTKNFVPLNVYIIPDTIGPGGVTIFGVTLSFLVSLGSTAIGLMVPGIWITWISFKVQNVKVPKAYLTKPVSAAIVAAIVFIMIKMFLPLRQIIEDLLTADVGGIVYTIIMIFSGVFLYLTLLVFFGGFTRQDGRFWRSVVGTIPVARALLIPIFAWGKFCLNRVPSRFRAEEYTWIMSTKKSDMEKDMEFTISDDFEQRYHNKIENGSPVEFVVKLNGIKTPFYHVIICPKVDMKRIENGIVYAEKIEADTEFGIKFDLPREISPGHHELYLDVEMYTRQQADINAENMGRRGWFENAFNFAYKWFDEKIRYITIV